MFLGRINLVSINITFDCSVTNAWSPLLPCLLDAALLILFAVCVKAYVNSSLSFRLSAVVALALSIRVDRRLTLVDCDHD